jgi:hypothetical protein
METELGERFPRPVATRDGDAPRARDSSPASFRAVTPDGTSQSDDGAVLDEVALGVWFSSERTSTGALARSAAAVGLVDRVRYWFEDGWISSLHVLTSGFVR